MSNLPQVLITNINNEKTAKADVLERSDKRIKVAIAKTDITITLTRNTLNGLFIGSLGGIEFSTTGKEI